MERQNSTATTSPVSSPASTSNSPTVNNNRSPASNTRPRSRKKRNWVLFATLRCFAVLGPLGFLANITYFQFYFPSSSVPDEPSSSGTNGKNVFRNPLNAIHASFKHRVGHHRTITGESFDNNNKDKTTRETDKRKRRNMGEQQQEQQALTTTDQKEEDRGNEDKKNVDSNGGDKEDDAPQQADKRKNLATTTTPPVMSGQQVLDRMQSHTTASWKECGSSVKSTIALTQQLLSRDDTEQQQQGNLRASSSRKSNRDGFLQPFALRLALQEHLNELQHAIEDDRNSTTQQQQQQQQQCRIPQRGVLDCDAETYSIIVTFQGQENFRPLFMNLLAWLTYPYISDIVVLMPHSDWANDQHTAMDAKYKERIKTWHATKNHKVSMIGLPKQLDENGDPNSKYSFETLLRKVSSRIKSDAVLFMDGSIIWDGNNRGITAGFELWKQNPHGIIATHKLHTGAPASMCQNSPQKLWTPFCDKYESKLHHHLSTLHQQYQNILDLNGVFVHRGMLCLLGQDPLASILRKNVWQSLDDKTDPAKSFAYVRAIVSIALLQIAGGPPLLFPPTIARPSNETQDYNNNWHYLPHYSELEKFEEVTANNTIVQKRTLLSLLGYFGNGLVANANEGDMIPYWCTAQKQVEGVFFITDIPWMEASGSKCKRVAEFADILKPVM